MSEYGTSTKQDINVYAKEHNALVVDLRSDTLTQPSPGMRLAMSNAVVGDDVYSEDPTVNELEEMAANMLGKEAALFVTSGTMGNLIAIMVHCDERGCEAYCGEDSHSILHEQGGASQLGGVMLTPIPTLNDGSLDLKILQSKLRRDSLHEPKSKLVIIENPINGRVMLLNELDKLSKFVKEHKLKLHLDGARIWNAVVASKTPVERLVEPCDSVTFCLSKGLGAPVGSVLCGSRDFITKARRIRKVLGGAMRQAGILAAAGIVALVESIPLLELDHQRARKLSTAINEIATDKIVRIHDVDVQTNILFVHFSPTAEVDVSKIVKNLGSINGPEDPKVIVQALALNEHSIRFVLYSDIDDGMLEWAIRKITYVFKNI